MAYSGNSVYAKVVTGGSGDSGVSGAKGFIGWTPDPTNASVNQGEAHSTQGSIPNSGTPQAQPINANLQ